MNKKNQKVILLCQRQLLPKRKTSKFENLLVCSKYKCITAHRYVLFTHFKCLNKDLLMHFLIDNTEEANGSAALQRSVSVLDAVNWIRLAVKKLKQEL